MRSIVALLTLLSSHAAFSQVALLEFDRMFGECTPIYSAASDSLILYLEADLRSKKRKINYRTNWLLPYSDKATRVLKFGSVTETKMNTDGVSVITDYEYLYYLGEGYAKLRSSGKEFDLEIVKNSHYKITSLPKIQSWIKLLFKDKTSPGWLLLDSEQVNVSGISC